MIHVIRWYLAIADILMLFKRDVGALSYPYLSKVNGFATDFSKETVNM